ncbi:MBL fold metallo-hydrolase [Haloprofundus marisrubri]|uniref:MBL fold metallo-hydrolase n=1 Tax=Haloprofundus marisrubri TaxID=1514971 RepID=A0A0W1RBK2_9EURY|nr:MBL fold metallo-hydrolase [Haloprofundus marisrubri]KTG10501.1 MBL fold metallo-hydrolase [Haloprofundus marisrubri]
MKRIQLGNTVFEGKNDVYLLDGETTVLVDTGVATAAVRDQLRSELAEFSVEFADVDEILVTHWHYDHAGLAGEIQAESDAVVRVHEADAPLVAGEESALSAENETTRRKLREWGLPDDRREELLEFLSEHESLAGRPAEVTPFADGDTFAIDGREFEAVHLPGHSAGLSAFAFEGDAGEEAFVGDAILPKYTPNVGGADVRLDAPLELYVDSLVRFIDRDFDRAWPGHRDVIDEPSARAATILEHHRERTENVVGVLREQGPSDPWTVSAALFGDLKNIHVLHGPGEAYAHLAHLAERGVAERDGNAYELVDENPDIDDLFPTVDDSA